MGGKNWTRTSSISDRPNLNPRNRRSYIFIYNLKVLFNSRRRAFYRAHGPKNELGVGSLVRGLLNIKRNVNKSTYNLT